MDSKMIPKRAQAKEKGFGYSINPLNRGEGFEMTKEKDIEDIEKIFNRNIASVRDLDGPILLIQMLGSIKRDVMIIVKRRKK